MDDGFPDDSLFLRKSTVVRPIIWVPSRHTLDSRLTATVNRHLEVGCESESRVSGEPIIRLRPDVPVTHYTHPGPHDFFLSWR